jgi:hypothetical protein
MITSSAAPLPEQGQIVTIRQRCYVVTDILGSTLPPGLLLSQVKPQHLVTLNAIEDDALGESLRVISGSIGVWHKIGHRSGNEADSV